MVTTEQEQSGRGSDGKSSTPKGRATRGRRTAETRPEAQVGENQIQQDQPAAQGSEGQQSSQDQTPTAIAGQDFGQLLQQQITQALQPVLADFRQQLGQSAERIEVEQVDRRPDSVVPRQAGPPPAESGQQPPQQSSRQSDGETRPQPDGREQSSRDQQPSPEESQGIAAAARSVLSSSIQFAERKGEDWIISVLISALNALLAESTHAAVQRRAEQGLHTVLQKTFDALPEGAANKDLQTQTERTLQAILRETIDAMFTEAARAALEEHGTEAGRSLVHRDFGGVVQQIQHALRVLLREFVEVLRRQWQRILRLLLRLILTALQDSLLPEEKNNLTDLSTDAGT